MKTEPEITCSSAAAMPEDSRAAGERGQIGVHLLDGRNLTVQQYGLGLARLLPRLLLLHANKTDHGVRQHCG